MPRSFLIKKKSDNERPAELSHPGFGCDDYEGGHKAIDQQPEDLAALDIRKHEPEVHDSTVIVSARRPTIWSPAAELHLGTNKTPAVNVSPTSGLTPFTPLSAAAAAAAAFLHPKGNYLHIRFSYEFLRRKKINRIFLYFQL